MSRVLFGVAYAVGIPVVGLALMVLGTVLVAFGPPFFDTWPGTAITWLLIWVGSVGAFFSQLRYQSVLLFLGGGAALIFGLYHTHTAFRDSLLLGRGELVTCTIANIDQHVYQDGGARYTYGLACARPDVTTMTTGSSVGQVGDSVTVVADPAGRLDPRPADAVGDPDTRAITGAITLGVAIALRLVGEFGPRSLRPSVWRRDARRRKEQRRIRRLAQARARGTLQDRVGWLLPYDRPDRNRPPTRTAYVSPLTRSTGSMWAVKPVPAQRCQVALDAAPPAIEEMIRSLCDLYVIGDERRSVPNVVAGDRAEVAADEADLRRWREATDAYLNELAAVNRDLWEYWVDHGQRLGVFWGRTARLKSWQDHVRSAYARLVRASDAYRPVFNEITAAIETTRTAEQDLQARNRVLSDWADRPLWYLKPTAEDSLVLVRSDVSGEPPPEGHGRTLPAAYEAARAEYHFRLTPVDWDEASLRACDAELAQISEAHPPVGTTASGRPLTRPAPDTFAAWFQQRFGGSHDRVSDRAALANLRQRRATRSGRGRPRSAGGGSWPTAPYIGHDSGGSDHSVGDYGGSDYGSSHGGSDYGSGYSGGGDYGGGYSGGFSVSF